MSPSSADPPGANTARLRAACAGAAVQPQSLVEALLVRGLLVVPFSAPNLSVRSIYLMGRGQGGETQLTPEEREQEDDRQRNAENPQ